MNRPFVPACQAGKDTPQAPTLEPSRLDELADLLGRQRFKDLLDLLIEDCRERPDRIRSCHARGDLAGLSAEATRLSRAATSIGATRLGEAASSLVSLDDLGHALPMIEALDQAARATLCVARHQFGQRFVLVAEA